MVWRRQSVKSSHPHFFLRVRFGAKYMCYQSLAINLTFTAAWLPGALAFAMAFAAPAAADPAATELFETKIRPILAEHCYECHSATSKKIKGGLRADSRANLLAGGDTGPALVPGKPDQSLLYKAITHQDPDLAMPAKKPKLPDGVIADFKRWIADGAVWPGEQVAAATNTAKAPFDLAERKKRLPWIWETPSKHSLPQVKNQNWPATDADRFILAKLEEKNISPAQPAEPQQWLRRVHFAITGLPPSAAELHEFLADTSPAARAKVADRLLSSPGYGERWARHWMDLVRYAESRGHESDFIIANAYHYRDYLIRALNADVPYDQFVREQIAGDLLPQPRLNPTNGANESVLGTGWVFLGEEVHSPVDIRQDECERTDNKVDVIGKTFLGLTLACARCHDHKFDAISAQDYYAMSGFVLSSSYRQVRFETMEQNHRIARELESARAQARPKVAAALASSFQPGLKQVADYLNAARKVIVADDEVPRIDQIAIVAVTNSLSADKLTRWISYLETAAKDVRDPLHLVAKAMTDPEAEKPSHLADLIQNATPDLAPALPAGARVVVDYSNPKLQPWKVDGDAFGSRPLQVGDVCFGQNATNPIAQVMTYGAARRDPFWNKLKTAPGNQNDSGQLAATSRAGQMLVTPKFILGSGKLHYLIKGKTRVYAAVDSHLMVEGPLHGQLVQTIGSTNTAPTWFTHDLERYRGQRTHLEFGPEGGSELEILMVVEASEKPAWLPGHAPWSPESPVHSLPQLVQAQQQALWVAGGRFGSDSISGAKDSAQQAVLANWLVQHSDLITPPKKRSADTGTENLFAKAQELDQQVRWESKTAVAWFDGTGVDENVLIRGKAARTGALAPRSLPSAFPGAAPIQPINSSGRYELAQQMTDPNNPLLARVIVNRIWHHLFGRGIVATVDNFGYLGERPSHPELLDHLSWQFVHEDNWSQKKLIKQLVLSSTFAMSSKATDARAEEIDGANVLLHHMPVRRLEGEVIRDSLLAVSGRLDPTVGGPPVPVHLTDFIVGRGRPEKSGPLDGDGRRSVYITVRRNFLSTFLLTFDMPNPFSTIGRRNVTNVPGQSLALMNDPLVHDQARVWAERLLKELKDSTPEERIRWMFESAYARTPSAAELDSCRVTLAEFQKLETSGDAGHESWANLCHSLLCANDFIYLK